MQNGSRLDKNSAGYLKSDWTHIDCETEVH